MFSCSDDTSIPGLLLPSSLNLGGIVGEHSHIPPRACQAYNGGAGCPKQTSTHKGFCGVKHNYNHREYLQPWITHHNSLCNGFAATHATLMLYNLMAQSIPELTNNGDSAAGYEISGNGGTFKIWRIQPSAEGASWWEVVSAGGNSIVCKYTIDNRPHFATDNEHNGSPNQTGVDFYIGRLYNSVAGAQAEFIITPPFEIDEMVDGEGTFTIYTATPADSEAFIAYDGVNPVRIGLLGLVGRARPKFPYPAKIRPIWGVKNVYDYTTDDPADDVAPGLYLIHAGEFVANYAEEYTRVRKGISGEFSNWEDIKYKLIVVDGDTYLDLRGVTIPAGVNAFEVVTHKLSTSPTDTTAVPVKPDRCIHSIEDYSGSIGMDDGIEEVSTFYCEKMREFPAESAAALRAGYIASNGICNQTACPSWALAWPGNVIEDCLYGVIYNIPFLRRQIEPWQNDEWQLFDLTHPSLFSLTMSLATMGAQAGHHETYEWYWWSTGFGIVESYSDGGVTKTRLRSGLELIDRTNLPGLGVNRDDSAVTNWNNTATSAGGDPDFQERYSVTNGKFAKHLYTGDNYGRVGYGAFVFTETYVQFPLINYATTDWQYFEDGRVRAVMRDGNREITTNPAAAVYYLDVQLKPGIFSYKDVDYTAQTAVTTVTVYQSHTAAANHVGLFFKHKARAIAKANASAGEDDFTYSVKRGGTNGIPDTERRERNHLSPMALIGAGAGAGSDFVSTGMALRIPDTEDYPEHLRGVLFPLTYFRALDDSDESNRTWDPAFYDEICDVSRNLTHYEILSECYDFGDADANNRKWCDRGIVYDPQNIFAELGDPAGMTFEVVEFAITAPSVSAKWWDSGPAVADPESEIASVYSHECSGIYHIPAQPVCLTGYIKKCRNDVFYSMSNDIGVVGTTLERMVTD